MGKKERGSLCPLKPEREERGYLYIEREREENNYIHGSQNYTTAHRTEHLHSAQHAQSLFYFWSIKFSFVYTLHAKSICYRTCTKYGTNTCYMYFTEYTQFVCLFSTEETKQGPVEQNRLCTADGARLTLLAKIDSAECWGLHVSSQLRCGLCLAISALTEAETGLSPDSNTVLVAVIYASGDKTADSIC